ncbi:hypothetical protein [Caminibacter pacificus]|uniref:Uncharacterized protein n=1 Tax=Caminibacter pacificus TaxID=1424653 RepID=A0AAJ4UX60_9BACT|nr:hypothetical protein [Caminibacter pacificus]QDD68202.1 hypothetical protein C6V80_10125 [Caminibacter pacificus]ROR38715.1 hypothetical protein EDC58_1930 [Caminibacter pacificus]
MKISLKKTADFVGITERTLYIWKTPKNINGVKYHSSFGKHNLYLGARIASYLFLNEKDEQENNFEALKNALEELKNCIKEEKIKPLEEFINAVEVFKNELKN